jgi:hypothetical protein
MQVQPQFQTGGSVAPQVEARRSLRLGVDVGGDCIHEGRKKSADEVSTSIVSWRLRYMW